MTLAKTLLLSLALSISAAAIAAPTGAIAPAKAPAKAASAKPAYSLARVTVVGKKMSAAQKAAFDRSAKGPKSVDGRA